MSSISHDITHKCKFICEPVSLSQSAAITYVFIQKRQLKNWCNGSIVSYCHSSARTCFILYATTLNSVLKSLIYQLFACYSSVVLYQQCIPQGK